MRTKLVLTFVLAMTVFRTSFSSNDQVPALSASEVLKAVKDAKTPLKVVNLWATWCGPCREELPHFAKAEKKFPLVSFFYVSGDDHSPGDSNAKIGEFLKITGVQGWRAVLNPINEAAFKSFAPTWSGSLPATFLYDASGNLLEYSVKPFKEKSLSELIKRHLSKTRKALHSQGQPSKLARMKTEFESKKSNPDFPAIHDVVAEEVNKKRSDVYLIDVRQPEEFTGELSHIPGAKLVVLNTLPERLSELPKDKPIVFVCRSGGRSARAAAFAKENGFDQVYNLKGGMLRWNELHLETESKKQ